MTAEPRVSVVIPTLNRRDDLLDCLQSVVRLDYPNCEVLVVQDGGSSGLDAAVRQRFPNVSVLELPDNRGFTGACNAGLLQARTNGAEAVLLLNDDATVSPDLLRCLTGALAESPGGIYGPTIYFSARPDVVWSAGGSIDWRRGHTQLLGLDQSERGQFGATPRRVDYLTGCCLLISAAALERVDGLDPRFFAYYEEVEWCVRAARAGVAIWHVPGAHAWHKIDPARQQESPFVLYYMTRNRLLLLAATDAPRSAWVHAAGENLRTLVSWSLRPKWRHRRHLRRAILRGWSDFARGRFGRAVGLG